MALFNFPIKAEATTYLVCLNDRQNCAKVQLFMFLRFEQDLKVTIQALGWMQDKSGRYLPLEDDIASVAFWYQSEPHAKFPALPRPEELTIKPIQVEMPK